MMRTPDPSRLHCVLAAVVCAAASMRAPQVSAQPAPDRVPTVWYTVTPDLEKEEFIVTAELHGITADTLAFNFPIWAPGAYDVVEFGRYAHDVTARGADGHELAVIHHDSNAARIAGVRDGARISYRIHDVETPRSSVWFCTSDIEKSYVFAQGAAILGYPAGYKDAHCRVGYDVPHGWSITVSLDSAAPSEPVAGGTRRYYAADNYDDLIDAPVQMGHWQQADFMVNGIPHTVTLTATGGKDTVDMKGLADITKHVVEVVSGFFGDMPYRHYVFQHYIANSHERKFMGAFGALEHAGSSTYLSPPVFDGAEYGRDLASTIAHEYFHVWSPKRIHVAELGPFDYQRAPRTASLWFAEGLTEYYSRILTLRSGIGLQRWFFSEMQGDLMPMRGTRQKRSIADLSRDISTASLDESTIALYSKGPVIGLLLDVEIRTQTDNRKSLDDAMRFFNEEYGKRGRTFGDDDIIPIMERATGAKLADFYTRYIAGTEPLPIDAGLARMGLVIASETMHGPNLGASIDVGDSSLKILSVTPGGSADSSGLRAGDVITKFAFKEGHPIPVANIPLGSMGVDEIARFPISYVYVQRNGREISLPLKKVESDYQVPRLGLDPAASGAALAIRKSMIGA